MILTWEAPRKLLYCVLYFQLLQVTVRAKDWIGIGYSIVSVLALITTFNADIMIAKFQSVLIVTVGCNLS